MKIVCLVLLLVLTGWRSVWAQPGPGDVFREYRWFHAKGDAGQAIHVGGKRGQVHPDRGSAHGYINAPFTWPFAIDLTEACKVEVVLEKIMCHAETTGLAIRTLTTGKTPKINGKMVHGMEVNWPGIMVLVQYGE